MRQDDTRIKNVFVRVHDMHNVQIENTIDADKYPRLHDLVNLYNIAASGSLTNEEFAEFSPSRFQKHRLKVAEMWWNKIIESDFE